MGNNEFQTAWHLRLVSHASIWLYVNKLHTCCDAYRVWYRLIQLYSKTNSLAKLNSQILMIMHSFQGGELFWNDLKCESKRVLGKHANQLYGATYIGNQAAVYCKSIVHLVWWCNTCTQNEIFIILFHIFSIQHMICGWHFVSIQFSQGLSARADIQ